ncbi:hypothetical protein KY284_005580 [Solanum tuberosum]|nr:hypothetical protein KY284_005580 [Solanum tuberosum]
MSPVALKESTIIFVWPVALESLRLKTVFLISDSSGMIHNMSFFSEEIELGIELAGMIPVLCVEKIQQTLSQSTVDESVVSPDDAVGKVLGKEHSGRVRCLGLEAVPTRVFKQARPRFSGMNTSSVSCSSYCQENYDKLFNAHNQMMAAFESYMIMKEGTLPEQFEGLFASPPTVLNITFTFSLLE